MGWQSKLVISIVGLFIATSMEAASGEPSKVAYLKRIEVLATEATPGQVRIAYQLACGESLRGLLINQSKSLVLIGAVVDRPETFCLSMPLRRELVISIASGRSVASFPVKESKRLLLAEVADVTLGKGGVSVSWQDTCRPFVGVVVTPASDNGGRPLLGINVASLPKEGVQSASISGCGRAMKRLLISGIYLPGDQLKVNSKPGRVKEIYALRLVAPTRISIDSKRKIALTWEKSCREKAVGIVFMGRSGSEVAIVSVYAPNAPCIGPSKSRATYALNHLSVPVRQTVKALSEDMAQQIGRDLKFNYRLQTVTSMKLANEGEADWLLASTAPSCGQRLGLVIGQDFDGNLAMASLADGNSKICHVSRANSAETLTAPLVGPAEGPLPKVFSLKVFGTAVN